MTKDEALLKIIELLKSPPEIYYSINIDGNSYEIDNSNTDVDKALRHYFNYGTDSYFFEKFMPEVAFTEEELERLKGEEYDDLKNCSIIETVRFETKDGGAYVVDSPMDEYGTPEEEADSEEAEEVQAIVNGLLTAFLYNFTLDGIVLTTKMKMLDTHQTLDPHNIIKLLKDAPTAKRIDIASNPDVHPEVLKELLLDGELLVVNKALKNPVIEQLRPEDRKYVNTFITLGKKYGPELEKFIETLSFEEIEPLLSRILRQKPHILEFLYVRFEENISLADLKEWIRWGIPDLTDWIAYITKDPSLLSSLSNSTVAMVRETVARNEYTPTDDLIKLVQDEEEEVADAALDNPNTPSHAQELRFHKLKVDRGGKLDNLLNSEKVVFKDNVSKNIQNTTNTDLELLLKLKGYLKNV